MKRNLYIVQLWWLLLLVGVASGCKKEAPNPKPTPEVPELNYPEGLSWTPKEARSDQPLEIIYKAKPSDALYGYKGALYAHIGIVDGQWQYVQAEWHENKPKCQLTNIGENTWSLKLTPEVRSWFGAPSQAPLPEIGIVFRSADGSKQSADLFIKLSDDQRTHAPTQKEAMPTGVKLGINETPEGIVLVLDAKDKQGAQGYHTAYVITDAMGRQRDETTQMKLDPATGYFWYLLPKSKLTKQDRFYYQLYGDQGSVIIADPYSEVVKWHDNLPYTELQNGVPSYQWQHPLPQRPKESQLMIYELHLRDFTANGKLKGAMEQLDYIKAMGFNAIELMPVQEFGGEDSWGYNPEYFFAMETAYGTPTEYKQFIDECHRRGIAVILDVVYNHATANNPFAKLYWDSEKGQPASNNPWMNPQAPHRGESFFCDFNHESPQLVAYVLRNLKYLLKEYRFDGFRFDFTKGFTQKVSNDATPRDGSRIAILRKYYQHIKQLDPTAYVIFEHFSTDDEKRELANMGAMLWQGATHAYAQCAMGYEDESDFGHIYAVPSKVRANAWVGYMESHDEERVAYKQKTWGLESIKNNPATKRLRLETNAAFLLLVPGPKMVWQFGEIGYDISIEQNGRTDRKPLIQETAERSKLRQTYTKLLHLRATYPELWEKNASFDWKIGGHWTNGRRMTLSKDGKELRVIGNFNALAPLRYQASTEAEWKDMMDQNSRIVSDTLIAPGGFVVLGNFQ